MYLQEPLQHWGIDSYCPVEKGGASQENKTGKDFRNAFWREEMKKLWN